MSELVQFGLSQDDLHVRACVDEAGDLADADVLYFAGSTTPNAVVAQLESYPGCAVCAGAAADGTLLLAVRVARGDCDSLGHVPFVASALHALLAALAER